jgi:hypothetical protein
MPDTLPNEVNRIAHSLGCEHGAEVSAVAALLHLSECLFTHYGQAHGVDLLPLLSVQCRCAESYGREQGFRPVALRSALDDLQRANSAVDYLSSLPG